MVNKQIACNHKPNNNLKGQSRMFRNLIACAVMPDISISLAVVISTTGPM